MYYYATFGWTKKKTDSCLPLDKKQSSHKYVYMYIRLRPRSVLPPDGSVWAYASCWIALSILSASRIPGYYSQIWRYPRNRKYILYRNAAKLNRPSLQLLGARICSAGISYFNDFCQINYHNSYWTELHWICRVDRSMALVFRSLKGCCRGNQFLLVFSASITELGSRVIRQMAAYDKKCKRCTGRKQTNFDWPITIIRRLASRYSRLFVKSQMSDFIKLNCCGGFTSSYNRPYVHYVMSCQYFSLTFNKIGS